MSGNLGEQSTEFGGVVVVAVVVLLKILYSLNLFNCAIKSITWSERKRDRKRHGKRGDRPRTQPHTDCYYNRNH